MITIDNDFKIRIQYEWQQLKKQGYQNNKVYIKDIPPKGVGVFAKEDMKAGDVVEMCHTFTASTPSKYVHDPSLSEYMLPGVINNELHPSFAFGFGCLYNSSDSAQDRNVEWVVIPESKLSAFVANRNIKKDEELLAWFGEGFYKSSCLPHVENQLKTQYHKLIDEKLSTVKLPNSPRNILQDNITDMLEMFIIENNKCNIKLRLKNLNDETLNKSIKAECEQLLKEISGLNNIEIYFT
jgi:hypothetical protein